MNIRVKRLLAVVAATIIIIATWQAYYYYQHRGLTGIKVVVLPEDSSLKLDSQSVKAGRIYVHPGTHTFIASRQDFDSDTETFSTNDLQKGDVIYVLPVANSQTAKQWLIDHPDIQRDREAAGGSEAVRKQRILTTKYPILSKLPYENLHYKIDYSIEDSSKPSFTVTLYAIINRPSEYKLYKAQLHQYRDEALAYLKNNDIDTNSFNINYIPKL
jgi:hypothetical protein